MNFSRASTLLGLCLLVVGCASTKKPRLHLTGNLLVDGPNAITNGPAKDQVLWQYRTAAAYMRQGRFDEAGRLLDSALARVEGVLGQDDSAKKSRRMFAEEAKKTFLGEPYERVMAYYYRGIIYWMDGEPDNARACFRSGQIHDSDTEDKTFSGDYVQLDYLDAYASAKLRGDGTDALKRAEALVQAKGATLQPIDVEANVLFFVEFGPGPTKFATGEYREQLRFRAARSPVYSASIRVGKENISVGPYDDLLFQATTRGGRVMDHILGSQAVFKKSTDTIGNAAMISGAILASGNKNQEIGAGLLLAGLASKLISAATTPQADTRSWDNLPLYLSFASMRLSPGQYDAVVEFRNESNQVLNNLTKTMHIDVPDGPGDKVIYVSDQSQTPQTL